MVSINYPIIDHGNGLRELVRTTSPDGRSAYTHARFGDGILCIKRPILRYGFGSPEVLDYYDRGEEGFEDLDKLLGVNC